MPLKPTEYYRLFRWYLLGEDDKQETIGNYTVAALSDAIQRAQVVYHDSELYVSRRERGGAKPAPLDKTVYTHPLSDWLELSE